MSTLPTRPPARGGAAASGSGGGGSSSQRWSRGGGPSSGAGGGRNQSVVFNSFGSAVPSSSTTTARDRGAVRGRGTRGGRGKHGRGGGAAGGNALERAGVLGDEDDNGDFAEDDEDEFSEDALQFEDDEGTKADKADARLQRFTSKFEGNRFEELRKVRVKERAEAMRTGAIDDPTVPRQLNARAKAFVGTCEDMCPEFEIEEREAQFNVDKLELLEGTINRIDHDKAVKMYHRPAAGNEQPLPSDVRTPEALRNTLDYLFTLFPASGPPATLRPSHGFVRDRMRAIRQDFTIQSSKGAIAIECHERMARYHIHCLHMLGEEEGFSVQQEMEQLRKILTSLIQFYTDLRNSTPSTSTSFDAPPAASVHEAEFSAYLLLTHLFDTDILRQTESLPPYLFHAPEVQLALNLAYLAQRAHDPQAKSKPTSDLSQNFFTQFFKSIQRKTTPYLFGAIVESHFGEVRKAGLGGMRKAFLTNHKSLPKEDLIGMLGLDDEGDLFKVLKDFGVEVGSDGVKLSKEVAITDNRQAFHLRTSRRIVGAKAEGWTNLEIINGVAGQVMYSETVSTPTRSVRSRKSTHTPSPKDPNFPFIGVPGDVESYADGDEGAGSPQEIVLKHDVIPKASSSLLPFPPFPKASLPTGAVSPSQASFPTPTLSPFTTPAISPQATPAPSPLPPSVFATPPLPPAPPSATSAFSLTSSTLPPPYGTSGVAPLTAAEKGKGREPPRRFQEIIIPSPSDFTSSTSSTPALESAPIQSVTSSTALDPLPPLRSPRLPSTPRTPLTPISLNARLASNLADQLFQLATAPLVKSIASRTLSQQLIDNIEAEDASNARALQQFLSGASRRFASELIDKRVKRRASEALADEFASRKLKRRTLEGMWAAVLKGDERREREAEFEEKVEFMGLGNRRAVVDDLRGLQVGDGGREVRPNVDYKEVERRMTELGKSRAAFWEHSTFLHSLVDHLCNLNESGPNMLEYDIMLSTVPSWRYSKAGSWLASKFGIKKGEQKSETVRASRLGVTVGDVTAMTDSEHVGLVVFECSPPSAPTGDAEDAERLRNVLALVKEENEYQSQLLVVGWTDGVSPLLTALLAEPDAPKHYVLILDTAEADDAFNTAVETFIRMPRKVAHPLVPVQVYLEALFPVWTSLVDITVDTLARITNTSPHVSKTIDRVVAVVNEHSSRVVTVVTSSEKEAEELYLPHFAPAAQVHDDRSLALAILEYLDLSRFVEDFAFGPLRSDVRSAYYSHKPPPVRAFLESIFTATSSRLARLPDVPERRFGDPRGLDETLLGFSELVHDVETKFVRVAKTAPRFKSSPPPPSVSASPPVTNHVNASSNTSSIVATSARPPALSFQPQQRSTSFTTPLPTSSTVNGKRPRESDSPDVFSSTAASPGSVDGSKGGGETESKYVKLRRIMAAAKGII